MRLNRYLSITETPPPISPPSSSGKPKARYKGTAASFFEANHGVFYPFFGSLYGEPDPRGIHILPGGRWWRAAKILIEYMWLHRAGHA